MKAIRPILAVALAAVMISGMFGAISFAQTNSASVGQALLNPVSINKASAEDLQNVNGIGLVIAQRIVEYRDKNGAFEALEDLMDVQGIGQAKFERIKEQITL